MKVKGYVQYSIDKFGVDKSILNFKNAINHHINIYRYFKSNKSLTTMKFFKNCLETVKEDYVSYYCQSEIEGGFICSNQCNHCKEYYAPIENKKKSVRKIKL